MNLAKYEVPRTKGMVAEMPGYARIDQITATLYWQFIGAEGGLEKLDRRDVANFFLCIEVPDYRDEDQRKELCRNLGDEAIRRRGLPALR